MDGSGALRPLDEAAEDIRRLHEYESREELTSSLQVVHRAIGRSLRLALRSDPDAPESERLRALSDDQLPLDEVIRSLRSRDRITLELAGTLHELDGSATRVAAGDARPADADVALRAVGLLRADLGEPHGPAVSPPQAEAIAADAAEPAPVPTPRHPRGVGRWMAFVAAALALVVVIGFAWVLLRGRGGDLDAGIMAFRSGRLDSAEVIFQRAVDRSPEDVTALLYLARIQRRQGRPEAAANTLRTAASAAPADPEVRRELGHLFLDLGKPALAARQYELALEVDPEDAANWTALIQAQRTAGDPRADSTLARAPAAVQAEFGYTGG